MQTETIQIDLGILGYQDIDVTFSYDPYEESSFDCAGDSGGYDIESVTFNGLDIHGLIQRDGWAAIEEALEDIRND